MLISNDIRAERGFTLVELTIVFVILATVLTMGLGALNAQLLSANYASTKKRQDAIKDTLIAYFGANSRLPCPTVPAAGTAIDGNQGAYHTSEKRCVSAVGTVPFRELGLTREAAEDGWGNLMTYHIYQDATPVCPGSGVSWGHKDCYGTGKTGALAVRQNAMEIGDRVVAVVVSHGGNGLGAWVAQGTRNILPAGCQELRNTGGAAGCTSGDSTNTFYKGAEPNDDILAALTATDIIVPLAKQGVTKVAIAQVAADLDTIKYDLITAKMPLHLHCTVMPSYTTPHDPWGNPYEVVAGEGGFPITIKTNGCGSCTPVVAPVSKSITKPEYNLLTGSACL